jgi:hypothetical protein
MSFLLRAARSSVSMTWVICVEAETCGLKVRLPGAPNALPAQTEHHSARKAQNALNAHGTSFHDSFHGSAGRASASVRSVSLLVALDRGLDGSDKRPEAGLDQAPRVG